MDYGGPYEGSSRDLLRNVNLLLGSGLNSKPSYMSYSLNSLKGVLWGDYTGNYSRGD